MADTKTRLSGYGKGSGGSSDKKTGELVEKCVEKAAKSKGAKKGE